MAEAPTKPRSARPRNGAEVELTVDSFAQGGNGVARLDGYVLFVQGAVPGDRVRAVVTKSKRDYGGVRARRRCWSRARTGSSPGRTTRARRGRCCSTSAS